VLKTRILTAIILGPAVLAVLFFTPDWLFRLAAAALLLTGCWEFRRLANLSTVAGGFLFLLQLSIIGLMHYHWDVFSRQAPVILPLGGAAWCLMYLRLWTFRDGQDTGSGYQALGFVCAVLAVSSCWFALSWLREQAGGQTLILLLLFIIWAADIGAYFSGRALGRTALAPKISPKKTWEGVIGGILLALLITYALSRFTPLAISPLPQILLLTVVTVMSSIGGDLFISIHKRSVKLKDAGNLFPGHGGVLDRFDSLLPGSVFFALTVWVIQS
jgi:phosphatidate cytidylyltransferase